MNVYSIVKEPEVLASLLIGEFFAIRTASNFKKIKKAHFSVKVNFFERFM